jgi:murein DD-endopeptidase MepM/ murein hydrolase activator NlpD
MNKPFVVKVIFLLMVCSSGLLVNAASAGHKGAAKAPAVRSSHRQRKHWRKGLVVSHRKLRRLSGKMAVLSARLAEGRMARASEGRMARVNEGLGSSERLKGHLPWPVESRKILIHFGLYEYMPGVTANNKGVTIAAEEGMEVHAVADGRVQEVFPELDAVMICHGGYFTIYSNVPSITVCKGDEIKAGQVIGCAGAGGQLDFWLTDGNNNYVDPERWLRR